MNTKEIRKPLELRLKEAENEIVRAVNNVLNKNDIPCFLFEPIFDKVHRQIKDEAVKERIAAEREYKEQLELAKKEEAEAKADSKSDEKDKE